MSTGRRSARSASAALSNALPAGAKTTSLVHASTACTCSTMVRSAAMRSLARAAVASSWSHTKSFLTCREMEGDGGRWREMQLVPHEVVLDLRARRALSRRYGEIWGDMGRCGETWGDMGRYGEIQRDLIPARAAGSIRSAGAA